MALKETKQRVNIVVDKELWERVKVVSAQCGMSASAFISFITYSYVNQHERMMDKFMNMTAEELAQYTACLKKMGVDDE